MEKHQKRVSISDVTKAAGVAISTVSRVTNHSTYPISDSATKCVVKAVEELSYNPNKAEQHLRRSFDNIIGLIVRDVSYSYFSEIARGITNQGIKLGYLAFVCNTVLVRRTSCSTMICCCFGHEMGCKAVEYIAQAENLNNAGCQFVTPKLIERESVATL